MDVRVDYIDTVQILPKRVVKCTTQLSCVQRMLVAARGWGPPRGVGPIRTSADQRERPRAS